MATTCLLHAGNPDLSHSVLSHCGSVGFRPFWGLNVTLSVDYFWHWKASLWEAKSLFSLLWTGLDNPGLGLTWTPRT